MRWSDRAWLDSVIRSCSADRRQGQRSRIVPDAPPSLLSVSSPGAGTSANVTHSSGCGLDPCGASTLSRSGSKPRRDLMPTCFEGTVYFISMGRLGMQNRNRSFFWLGSSNLPWARMDNTRLQSQGFRCQKEAKASAVFSTDGFGDFHN